MASNILSDEHTCWTESERGEKIRRLSARSASVNLWIMDAMFASWGNRKRERRLGFRGYLAKPVHHLPIGKAKCIPGIFVQTGLHSCQNPTPLLRLGHASVMPRRLSQSRAADGVETLTVVR